MNGLSGELDFYAVFVLVAGAVCFVLMHVHRSFPGSAFLVSGYLACVLSGVIQVIGYSRAGWPAALASFFFLLGAFFFAIAARRIARTPQEIPGHQR